ncbi:MAG: hypothetical protein U0794_10120 [Isosphaeraceae bacterium]
MADLVRDDVREALADELNGQRQGSARGSLGLAWVKYQSRISLSTL